MKTYNITLIPGDGVGPEVTEATKRVLEATGIKFKWDLAEVGSHCYGKPRHTPAWLRHRVY